MASEETAIAVLQAEMAAIRELIAAQRLNDQRALELRTLEMARRLEAADAARAVAAEELRKTADDLNRRATEVAVLLASNSADISALRESQTWLSRLLIGAVLVAVVGYVASGLRWGGGP